MTIKSIAILPIMFICVSCGGGSSNNSSPIPDDDVPSAPPAPAVLEVKTLPNEVVLFSTGASS